MTKLKRSECVVLPLVLKGTWYDMIASGVKTEEYRDVTPRYISRFRNFQRRCSDRCVDPMGHGYQRTPRRANAVVAFSRGYVKPSMFFTIRCSLARGTPPVMDAWGDHWAFAAIRSVSLYPEWGEPNGGHFVIQLCDRVELVDE